jgi:hypothetical protein
LVADYFLLEPVGQFAIHSTSDLVGLAIFCISGVTVSVVTGLYQRSRERRAAYGIKAAVLKERGKVEEAGELAEAVRAERLRFLGVLESLRPMSNSTASSEAVSIDRELHGASGMNPGFRLWIRRDSELRFAGQWRFHSWPR